MGLIWLVLFILLLSGTPIAVAIGLFSVLSVYLSDISMMMPVQNMFSGIDSFTLMAIPLFIFAGDLMLAGGSSSYLIEMAKDWIGWTTGGLPITAVIASMLFAALSGSSPATVAAVGGIMLPSLREAAYSDNFSLGLLCTSGSLGIIIPPSITLLVYGVMAEVSISRLFLAGIVPGIIIGIVLIILSYYIARKENYEPAEKKSWSKRFRSTRKAIWAFIMPVIVLGGIYGGVFTPTEAAAVAVAYSMFIGIFVYKGMTISDLFETAKKSALTSCMIMFVISAAEIFTWFLTFERIPVEMADSLLAISDSRIFILLAINVMFLILGMFVSPSAAVVMLTPIFLPVVIELGVDPIHFGVFMIVNLSIGMITPPFGLNLFVATGLSGRSITQVSKSVMPFILVMLVLLLVITFIPQISLLFL